jgi:UDP-glucose 4-epimerase
VGRIAVTGGGSFLGGRLLRRLAKERPAGEIVVLDRKAVDLTAPAADQQLLELFSEQAVETVVHLAFFSNPQRDRAYAHELESIGTLAVLSAAAAAGVRHVVMRSTTAVYGARGKNPNFIAETSPLQPNPELSWAQDKLEAEQHAAAFAKRYSGLTVTVLRLATLFGPGVRTFYTSIFDRRLVPVLMGFDPLVQLLHPDDALAAFVKALAARQGGAFNVVPKRPIPLLTALHLSGKVTVPVPHPAAYALADALWALGAGPAPGAFLDYVRYLFVADGERAERELGFLARHTSREALEAYLRERYPATQGRYAEARP